MIVSQYIIIMIHYIYSNNLFTYGTGTVLYGYILYIYRTVPYFTANFHEQRFICRFIQMHTSRTYKQKNRFINQCIYMKKIKMQENRYINKLLTFGQFLNKLLTFD